MAKGPHAKSKRVILPDNTGWLLLYEGENAGDFKLSKYNCRVTVHGVNNHRSGETPGGDVYGHFEQLPNLSERNPVTVGGDYVTVTAARLHYLERVEREARNELDELRAQIEKLQNGEGKGVAK